MMQTKELKVSNPSSYLTFLADGEDEKNRQFAKVITLCSSAPDWDEWTEEQYMEWEQEYRPQEEQRPITEDNNQE